MEPTRAARGVVAVMLAVTIVAGAVTFTDIGVPRSTVQEPPEDGPTALAYTALQKTGTGSFAVTVSAGNDSRLEPAWRTRVEHPARRARTTYLSDRLHVAEGYVNAHGQWARYRDATGPGAWTFDPVGRFPSDPYFAHADAVTEPDANVTVVSRTSDTVTLQVTDPDTVFRLRGSPPDITDDEATTYEGSATFVVARTDARLRRATVRTRRYPSDARPGDWQVVRYEFTDWGRTDVDRPTWAQYTTREILDDLTEWGGDDA